MSLQRRVFLCGVAGVLGLLLPGFSNGALAGEPLVRVAIYDHSPDQSGGGPKNLMSFLTREEGFACTVVSPETIREQGLQSFDVLIMPGGSGSAQAEKLQAKGGETIKDFVKAGGGYVGICAGSYLASSNYDWSLNLINARVWDRAHWARGTGEVTLCMTDPGQKLLSAGQEKVECYYGQGPLFVPDDKPDLPGYEVLAAYETEIAEKGAPKGAMTGTHAIIRSLYGQGRVICFSPHPEKTGGPRNLMTLGVKWAAGN